jgi:hypothetical protein
LSFFEKPGFFNKSGFWIFCFFIFMSDLTAEGAEGAEEEGREMNNFKVYL